MYHGLFRSPLLTMGWVGSQQRVGIQKSDPCLSLLGLQSLVWLLSYSSTFSICSTGYELFSLSWDICTSGIISSIESLSIGSRIEAKVVAGRSNIQRCDQSALFKPLHAFPQHLQLSRYRQVPLCDVITMSTTGWCFHEKEYWLVV